MQDKKYKIKIEIVAKRFGRVIDIFRNYGIKGLSHHLYIYMEKKLDNCNRESRERSQPVYDISNMVIADKISKREIISFTSFDNPLVSIIVPTYNQFEFTYQCLRYIKKYALNIAYEVIVADDCSSDETCNIEKVCEGIRVLYNDRNQGFIKNCNKAVKTAKGKYIHLLNNDTQVQYEWLRKMIDFMENNPDTGLVGSKLIYSNSLVQEAGGIVWKDGSIYQYGNGRRPYLRELCFKREADYISGASIVIKRSLWDKIGGFDEMFCPSYYEDVDLAFKVRKKGFKVIFLPESEVIHFEGASGRGEAGKTERIEKNRLKFVIKWKSVLEKNHTDVSKYPQISRLIKRLSKIAI